MLNSLSNSLFLIIAQNHILIGVTRQFHAIFKNITFYYLTLFTLKLPSGTQQATIQAKKAPKQPLGAVSRVFWERWGMNREMGMWRTRMGLLGLKEFNCYRFACRRYCLLIRLWQGNIAYMLLKPGVFHRYMLPPEISKKRLKNSLIFSITVSLFWVLSPDGVNLETGGSILANPVPVVWTYPSLKALLMNL